MAEVISADTSGHQGVKSRHLAAENSRTNSLHLRILRELPFQHILPWRQETEIIQVALHPFRFRQKMQKLHGLIRMTIRGYPYDLSSHGSHRLTIRRNGRYAEINFRSIFLIYPTVMPVLNIIATLPLENWYIKSARVILTLWLFSAPCPARLESIPKEARPAGLFIFFTSLPWTTGWEEMHTELSSLRIPAMAKP